jgi:hypothetical protein
MSVRCLESHREASTMRRLWPSRSSSALVGEVVVSWLRSYILFQITSGVSHVRNVCRFCAYISTPPSPQPRQNNLICSLRYSADCHYLTPDEYLLTERLVYWLCC